MFGFWLPKPLRRSLYRVLVRPTKQGEFLVFPFAYHRGGKGYVVSRTLLKELDAPYWGHGDTAALVLSCALLLAAFLLPMLMLGLPVVIAAWLAYSWRRYQARLAGILPRARFGGLLLTRARYQLELASLLDRRTLGLGLGCTIAGAGLLGILTLIALQEGAHIGAGVLLVGMGASLMMARTLSFWLKKNAAAFQHSVHPGDAVDVPIPEVQEPTAEQ